MIKWTLKLLRAKEFARAGYDSIGLKRKYSLINYWYHPEEVAEIVSEVTDDEDVIIATFFHDLIEDVNKGEYTLYYIAKEFGSHIANLVWQLTDVYTKEAYPMLNRAQRKKLEAERLSLISKDAQDIKISDIISNTADIVKHDIEFAKTYLQEKEVILSKLKLANSILLARAYKQLEEGKKIILNN